MHVDPKFSMAIHLTDVYTSKKKEKNMWKEHSWKIFCNMIWLYANMLKNLGTYLIQHQNSKYPIFSFQNYEKLYTLVLSRNLILQMFIKQFGHLWPVWNKKIGQK
jgi:hypothetical protein